MLNITQWMERISHRTDLSAGIVHLTKANDEMNALNVLMKILEERTICGSTNRVVGGTKRGFICGDNPVVCFQDVPLYSLSENISHEITMRANNAAIPIRYSAFGLRFNKRYVFKNGGRPVIYEKTEIAKQFLPNDEHWRIVRLDLDDKDSIIDWTHEREWRIKGDFHFDLKETEVLLSNRKSLKNFYSYCKKNNMIDILNDIKGIITLRSLIF